MGADERSHDKRTTPRYPTRGATAHLTWKVGDGCQSLDLLVDNISMGGLAALANAIPPAVSPLWISLPGAATGDWVEVSLVDARRKRVLFVPRRNYVLRMKFKNGCAFELFKNAVRGFARDFVSEGPVPDDVTWFNRHSWR